MAIEENDWRLQGQERYLKRATLTFRKYRRNSNDPDWDHDHCEFCWAKFMVDQPPPIADEGYCTLHEYRWICSQCFADFQEAFEWEVVETDRAARRR